MSGKENSSEEIDLGQLFKLIGNAFNRLSSFIVSVFKGLFGLLINFLLFIRVNLLKFIVAGFIGCGIGFYFDAKSEPIYISSMIVEPNFNSVQQLYNNIEFYNELAKQGDSLELSSAFEISKEEAASIAAIRVESFTDATQKLRQFSYFITELDSASRELINYEDYLRNFNDINSKFHKIQVLSLNPNVAKKCQSHIVRSIENNQYFKLQKNINDQNIKFSEDLIHKQMKEIDSLQNFYQKIKTLEANKANGVTSINMADTGKNLEQSEIELLKQKRILKNELISLNKERANTQNTINVISDFPNKGVMIGGFFSRKSVIYAFLFIAIVFVFLMFLRLNRYLINYNQN